MRKFDFSALKEQISTWIFKFLIRSNFISKKLQNVITNLEENRINDDLVGPRNGHNISISSLSPRSVGSRLLEHHFHERVVAVAEVLEDVRVVLLVDEKLLLLVIGDCFVEVEELKVGELEVLGDEMPQGSLRVHDDSLDFHESKN